MPATKMTAKKSNGGTAPRVTLKLPVDDSQSVEDDIMVSDEFEHNEARSKIFIYGSVGADSLFCCNECPRVTCLKCMDVPEAFRTAISVADVTFKCICCHIQQQEDRDERQPYFGFYKNGRPVLSKFLPIAATLEVSQRAQISSASVLFLHLKLVNCDTSGGSFELAYKFLKPYFPRGGIKFVEVAFDVATGEKAAGYKNCGRKTALELMKQRTWARVVIAITNHTDNVTGDPFAGYDGGQYISGEINEFLDIILQPWKGVIKRAQESYLWFFCCGAMVNNPTSFAALQKSLLAHPVTASIAFNAVRLQPSFASHLLLAFVEYVLLERFSITHSFQHMLGQSYRLGRHTDIFLMTTETGPTLIINLGGISCPSNVRGVGWLIPGCLPVRQGYIRTSAPTAVAKDYYRSSNPWIKAVEPRENKQRLLFTTQAEFLAALQDPNLPSPYDQLHAQLPGDPGVVVMPGLPQIESGSKGDTSASGKLKKTAVVAALEAVTHVVAELERKGKVYEHQLEEILVHQNMMAFNESYEKEKRITELKEYFGKKIEETLQRHGEDKDEDDTDDEDDGDD
ncbi:hypothetical protein BDR07DRAFT_1493291 [Suillus spraguei]|nr:hypothetical protein BDR07DRAFT_1493291 [Suillus spraguei]